MILGLGMIHSHYTASQGASSADKGFYTTVEANEVINFPLQLNCIQIYSKDTALEICFNNDPDPMFLDANSSDGISGLPINRIIVKGAAGQKIKWMALVGIHNT